MAPRLPLLLVPAALPLASSARAAEGQWPPGMLGELSQAHLQQMGLRRPVSDLWADGEGLLGAVVNFGGCSGAFISADGLVATNHHCAYSALQAASTVEHDHLKAGFVARTRADEIPAKGRGTLLLLQRIDDVTAELRAVADRAERDEARRAAVEAASVAMAEACEAGRAHVRCEVKRFGFGARFERHQYLEFEDVRVVFAPPSAIGEYGGEVDNWMWPRHAGDFALLRAYVGPDGTPRAWAEDNVPYRPERHLAVGHEGVAPGDFVAILGFPGQTERYLWAAALRHQVEAELPALVDLYGEWLQITRAASEGDREVAIKVAALNKGLANRHKNLLGMLAGIQRMDLLARRDEEWAAIKAAAEAAKDLEALQALMDLERSTAQRGATLHRDILLTQLSRGPRMLAAAVDLVRRAEVRHLPDDKRRPAFQERNADLLWKTIERRVADFDPEVEGALLTSWLRRAAALPVGQRLRPVDDLAKRLAGVPPEAIAQAILAGTALPRAGMARRYFDRGTPSAMREASDALLVLAIALAPEVERVEAQEDLRDGVLLRSAPHYLRALARVRTGPLYPDANGTLRVSVAQVMGYSPQDGLLATPQTTLQGQLAKDTHAPPFELPESVRAAARAGAAGYFADPALEDVPVCFLANGDTTGGNSGSALIDGEGRWVGLNFDRVWENIAGDVAYNPARSRNISVDVRFVLWLLSITEGAQYILQELGVAELAKAPRRTVAAPAASASPAPAPKKSACACVVPGATPANGGALVGLAVLYWIRRRRGASG
ncbi:MAG: S46 family peptidase [Deltaproteobacteria bacterium]|nr:S46 family peptidase [Deltaproteobacteria bacterium]